MTIVVTVEAREHMKIRILKDSQLNWTKMAWRIELVFGTRCLRCIVLEGVCVSPEISIKMLFCIISQSVLAIS